MILWLDKIVRGLRKLNNYAIEILSGLIAFIPLANNTDV